MKKQTENREPLVHDIPSTWHPEKDLKQSALLAIQEFMLNLQRAFDCAENDDEVLGVQFLDKCDEMLYELTSCTTKSTFETCVVKINEWDREDVSELSKTLESLFIEERESHTDVIPEIQLEIYALKKSSNGFAL